MSSAKIVTFRYHSTEFQNFTIYASRSKTYQMFCKANLRAFFNPFVCVYLVKIKVYVFSRLPISKMTIMLVYFICFGHNSILFFFLGSMLIKFEDLKFKLFNCLKESCQGAIINNIIQVIFNSCTYHSALSPITFPFPVNERA